MFQWLLKKQQQTVKTLNPSTQSIVAYQSHRLGGAAFKQDKGNYQKSPAADRWRFQFFKYEAFQTK